MAWRAVPAAFAALAACGCGDCITLGYPAARITAAEAASGAPIPLAGAAVNLSINGGARSTDTLPSTWTADTPYQLCCTSGHVQLGLKVPGYAQADTTFDIDTRGFCHVPIVAVVVVRLSRLIGSGTTADTSRPERARVFPPPVMERR